MKKNHIVSSEPSPPESAAMADVVRQESEVNLREWWWLALSAAGLMAVYFSPLREHLTHLQQIKADLAEFGMAAPLVFALLVTVLTAIGLPRLALYPIGGMAFGMAEGLLMNLIGTVGGAYLTFAYARWAGRSMVMKKWPGLARVTTRLDGRGFLSVALIRQMPSPGFLTNLLFGISSVRTRCYLIGTAIGSIPSAIPATLIGSSLSHDSDTHRIGYIIASGSVVVVMWLVFGWLFRRHMRDSALEGETKTPPEQSGGVDQTVKANRV
jgi:uncharacterized membrane protein YdjX (TVP38/TMEM64 family)